MTMKIGASTGCLYPELTENSLKLLSDAGFDLFEIFFNTFSELEPDFLDKIIFLCTGCGAKIASIHPFTSAYESYLLFSGYERRFIDGVRMYDMFFRTAAKLGAEYVVLHGMQCAFSSVTIEEYCRRFALLSDEAASFGVTLLQENVYRHISGSIDTIRRMRELLGEKAAFVLDTKQARRCGYDPCDVAVEMNDSLKYLHISDSNENESCLLPGSGSFDFNHFFDILEKTGYSGNAVIEVYGQTKNDIGSVINAKRYLDKLISDRAKRICMNV